MINNFDYIPPSMIRSAQDPILPSYAANQRLKDLYDEAHQARLAQQFRMAHPELTLRYRAAASLRRLADRIAPSAQRGRPTHPRVVRT